MLETIALLTAVNAAIFAGAKAPVLPAACLTNTAGHPTIVHLVSRDQVVTIRAGRTGPMYSVTQKDGKVLIANASEADFARLQPEAYRRMKQATATASDATAIATVE